MNRSTPHTVPVSIRRSRTRTGDANVSPRMDLQDAISALGELARQHGADSHTLDQALERFEREYLCEQMLASGTLAWRRLAVRRLRERFGDRTIGGSWRAEALQLLADDDLAPTARRMALVTLTRVLRLADLEWGWRSGRTGLHGLRAGADRQRLRFLSDDEIARLLASLEHLDRSTRTSPRTLDAIRFILHTGLRCSSAGRLRWTEVELRSGQLHLAKTKTGPRSIQISAAAIAIVARQRRASDFVFWGAQPHRPTSREAIRLALRRAYDHANIGGACVHTLRHTWASLALRRGVPSRYVQEVLGHTSRWMTARYQHVCRPELARACDQVSAAIEGVGRG